MHTEDDNGYWELSWQGAKMFVSTLLFENSGCNVTQLLLAWTANLVPILIHSFGNLSARNCTLTSVNSLGAEVFEFLIRTYAAAGRTSSAMQRRLKMENVNVNEDTQKLLKAIPVD